MTDPRTATDAIVAAIVPNLSTDLLVLRADESRIEALMEPLRAEVARVRQEIAAVYDLAEEQASTDAELVALSVLDRGRNTLDERARSLHPYISEITGWAPDPHDDQFLGPLGFWAYLGAHVYLDRTGRGDRALDAAQAESLAAALVTFTERFTPVIVEAGDYPGMAFAHIFGSNGCDDPGIWYSRDGQQAHFVENRRHRAGPEKPTTLVEACTRAIKWAQVDRSDDDGY